MSDGNCNCWTISLSCPWLKKIPMKNLFAVLVLVLLTGTTCWAQGHGGSGSGSGSGGSGSGHHGSGGHGSAAQPHWPAPVQSWLDNGAQGPIPQVLLNRVRQDAKPWLMQTFGLTNGQIQQRYNNGQITITYIATAPPTPVLSFRVAYGGLTIIIIMDTL